MTFSQNIAKIKTSIKLIHLLGDVDMAKSNKAKEMVMQPCFRMKVVEDKKKKSYNRKAKHKNRGFPERNRDFSLVA